MTPVASSDTMYREMVERATKRDAVDVPPAIPHPSHEVVRTPPADTSWSGADALRRAGATLRRGWPLIALTVVVGVVGAVVALQAVTPLYRTTTVLLVRPAVATTAADQQSEQATAVTRAVGLSQIGGTLPAERAAGTLAGLPGAPPDLGIQVFSSATGADPFVTITVLGPDAAQVSALARAYVRSLPASAEQLGIFPDATVELLVLKQAPAPAQVYPPTARMILAGVGAGLVLGVGLLVTPQLLTRRLRTSDEIEAGTGWPVLGRIRRGEHGAAPDVAIEGHRQLAVALAAATPVLRRVEVIGFDGRGRARAVAGGLAAALAEQEVDLEVVAEHPSGRPDTAPTGAAVLVLVAVSERHLPSPRDIRSWQRALVDEPAVGVVLVDVGSE